jgi:hypothetical protein
VVIGLGYVLIEPTSRSILWGVLHGESFYRGKPTNYWDRLIQERDDSLFSQFSPRPLRPFPWKWIDQLGRIPKGRQLAECEKLLQPLLGGDPAAVPVLTELLGREDEGVRVTAAQGLRAVGPAAKDAAPALARGLSDTEEVQEKSFQALAAIGPAAGAAVPALKAIIRAGPGRGPAFDGYAAGDSYMAKWPRIAAATVLWRIAPEDEDILPALLDALNDREEPDKRLQTAAIQGLGAMGPRAGAAVPRLLEVIKTDDNSYRVEEAAEALKKIDPDAVARVGVK